MAKNQANAKQHPEAELLLFKIIDILHPQSSKNDRRYSKNQAKERVYLYSWDYTVNHNKNQHENEKKRDHIDRT